MLNLVWSVVKLAAFAAIVLVAAHFIHWNGRTVSDQIDTHLAHTEHSPLVKQIRSLTSTGPATTTSHTKPTTHGTRSASVTKSEDEEPTEVTPKEREELRRLLKN